MKTVPVLLGLSLAANVALAIVWFIPGESAPVATSGSARTAATNVAKPKVPTREEELAAALLADPEFAEAIKSGDPKRLREALIRGGFPDSYVRDMVTFLTGNTVTAEHLALLSAQAKRPFWKMSPGAEEIALQKLIRERDEKGSALTKAAFGGKIPPHPLEAQNQQRRYRFLPEEKIAAVARIDSDYNDYMMENRNATTAEGREKVAQATRDRREALVKTLTPAELDQYDLNISTTAQSMRSALVLFQPTEAEFRAIYDIRRVMEDKYAGMYSGAAIDQALMQQRVADQKAVDERVKNLLGDSRYEEYVRTQDGGYRAAVEIASHFNLAPSVATDVYKLQKSYQDRVAQMAAGSMGNPTGFAPQAAALLTEAKAQFTQLLGAAGADAYVKTGGRYWMTGLERVANPTVRRPGGNE